MGHREADQYARSGERLKALHRYEILGSEEEAEFDRLVRLAAHLMRAPMALISLVDRDRQWFKARVGLEVEETGLDASFCKFAILERRVMVVPDASCDERFCGYASVVGTPKLRFYAGAPLISEGGHRLGTICVLDVRPRAGLGEEEEHLLGELACAVVDALELRRMRRERPGRERARHETSQEMERLGRLAAMGAMAAGVGHEINNSLAYVLASMAFAQGLLERSVQDETRAPIEWQEELREVRGALEDASEGALRMRDIVRDLGALSRGEGQKEALDVVWLDESLELALRMARMYAEGCVELEVRVAKGIRVRATRSGLTQVLLNLLLNAIHAVMARESGPRRVQVRGEADEGRVALEVEDTGVGMGPEALSRVFELFFTTKGPEKGTGLGLPISLRLVQSFGGTLTLSSEAGLGTRVEITLLSV
ncbi:hypothetical protein DL240_11350 [Lujinxingia litoralis]|uniref:histidine kinase n=1 Tax=Lujinxingia litoralis TaxID=2211119 RepID=A0A328C935_9DELT|nr:GAF domain-containing sensor histidine kinase [Lujinxingia litoralis]RAL22435.1 hypothetical protein DL240_11350 [Lujinxingia litoralis]